MNLFKDLLKIPTWAKKQTNNEVQDFPEEQTIAKIEKGESFKGHSSRVSYFQEANTKGEFIVDNFYYSGGVGQRYNIDNNTTLSTYSIQSTTPKWLAKKLDLIGDTLNPNHNLRKSSSDNWYIKLNDNPSIHIHQTYYNVKYDTIFEGVKFNTHYDNITELKELSLLYRKVRDKLKFSDMGEITKHIISDYYQTSGTPFKLEITKNFTI